MNSYRSLLALTAWAVPLPPASVLVVADAVALEPVLVALASTAAPPEGGAAGSGLFEQAESVTAAVASRGTRMTETDGERRMDRIFLSNSPRGCGTTSG